MGGSAEGGGARGPPLIGARSPANETLAHLLGFVLDSFFNYFPGVDFGYVLVGF